MHDAHVRPAVSVIASALCEAIPGPTWRLLRRKNAPRNDESTTLFLDDYFVRLTRVVIKSNISRAAIRVVARAWVS